MTTDAPGQSAQLFLRVVRVLDPHGIPYAAIGALAAAYFDIDLVKRLTARYGPREHALLEELLAE